jgi:pimeloyl-ACP methyl ester carboxylesterase
VVTEKVESKDGTQIAYEKVGSGPPLVVVGGAFCDRRARAAGIPLARLLADSFTVYCVDRRGRGDSTDTSPYAVAREVEDVAALVGVTGEATFAYGYSSGAMLLIECALAGVPLQKLALYEPPLVLEPHREAVPVDLGEQLVALTTAGKRSEAAELFLTRAIGMPAPYVQQMKAGPAWRSLEAISHTLSYDAAITRDPRSVLARAPGLTIPTLLLDGTKSQGWMRAAVAELAKALPHAQYRGLPEQTHDVMPQELAPHLLRFFLG